MYLFVGINMCNWVISLFLELSQGHLSKRFLLGTLPSKKPDIMSPPLLAKFSQSGWPFCLLGMH